MGRNSGRMTTLTSSQDSGVRQSMESPTLEYSPVTPGTVFKNLQQTKSANQSQGNSLRNSHASAISADDPNSIYSSMYNDSEETTMSTIDNSLDLNNSSEILYPIENTQKPNTAVNLNAYLEMPSAIAPTKEIPLKNKTKGIAVMDTPSPSPGKQSYSLLAQLRPNSIVRRSSSEPPSQSSRNSETAAGDDEIVEGFKTKSPKIGIATTSSNSNEVRTAESIKKSKKSTSIFDLFDGKDSLKLQDQAQGKKASPLNGLNNQTTPNTTSRQHKSITFDDKVITHHDSSSQSHTPSTGNGANRMKKSTPSPPSSSSTHLSGHSNKQTGSLSPPPTTSIKVNIPTVNTIRKDTYRKETTSNPKKSPASSTPGSLSKKSDRIKSTLIDHKGALYDDSLFDLLEDLD